MNILSDQDYILIAQNDWNSTVPKICNIYTLPNITKNKIANSSRVVAGAMCLYTADGKNCTCTIMC